MKRTALVTGAARGIGLELCRLLLERDFTVVGCPRRGPAEGLSQLAETHRNRLHEVELDVGDDASVARAAERISGLVDHLDLLVNNAGTYPKDGPIDAVDPGALVEAFEVNAVGPLRVVRALLPLLRRGEGRRVIQITSLMGSIADNGSGGSYAYRMSKAALNMATRNLAHDLGPEGFAVLAIHPGWVRTRMGGSGAPLELAPAAEAVLRTALAADPRDGGCFRGPDGQPLPW